MREDAAIAYIYCSYREQHNQTVVNLIMSLLLQIVRKNDVIPDEIKSLYIEHRNMRSKRMTCSKLLQQEVRRHSKVFIVIDALDECPESNGIRESFLAEIRELLPSITTSVRYLATH